MTGTWQDLGIELAWRAVPAGLGEGGSSWPLDREWINQVSIRWPSQYAWPDAHKWLDPLRHGLQRFVRVSPAILPQPFEHIILIDSADLRYVGGGGVVRYSRFLREVADAKICINLPGNGDLCFRLIDYLAVGACVIGPRLRTQLHVPLVDREHIVYTADDLSDLVPLCRRYLQDDAERERMRLATQALFDQFLCRHQLAAYYLYQCQGRLQP